MACDDLPDSNLSQDQCISIADGSPNWWLSPDIMLTDPSNTPDQAATAGGNLVDVRTHRAGGACNLLEGTNNIITELWVCNPSLVIAPGVNSTMIFQKIIPLKKGGLDNFPAGSSVLVSQAQTTPGNITWTINTSDPNQAVGHKCLIARSYPETLTPDSACFHAVKDAHVAQRNIQIIKVMGLRGESQGFARISTVNPNKLEVEPATFRVLADLNPAPSMVDTLIPALRATSGFKRIVRSMPGGFVLQLPDFPDAEITDHTRLGWLARILGFFLRFLGINCPAFEPRYEAKVKLKPGQMTDVNFKVNLPNSNPGDAHIFHVTQISSAQQVIGGVTVIAVVE